MNILIFGATGSIGHEFSIQLSTHYPSAQLHLIARNPSQLVLKSFSSNTTPIVYTWNGASDEALEKIISSMPDPIDICINAIGTLHNTKFFPEKKLATLSTEQLHWSLNQNLIPCMLICKHVGPQLNKHAPSTFATITARVGSIKNNHLGGWYSYRASKAAMNMIIKTTAIETQKRNKQARIIAIHPGTVASTLSEPFQKNVPEHKLFSAQYSVKQLLKNVVLNQPQLTTGKFYAYDGSIIDW